MQCLFGCVPSLELGRGVAAAEGHSMLLLHHYLMSWTDVSRRLRWRLVHDGHLLQHFFEIKELSNTFPDDKVNNSYNMGYLPYIFPAQGPQPEGADMCIYNQAYPKYHMLCYHGT